MIKLENVSKQYKGKIAVSNLQLWVDKGEIVGLLGANGAGKSTTINLLLGFLQPDAGQIWVNGHAIPQHIDKARQSIGYIPENVSLYPYLSGIENLDYFCRLAGCQYNQSTLSNYLVKCGLFAEAHSQKVAQYSKGMRQKVGIAIAYAKKAQVYLLDEPASGLDPLASNELSGLLKQLASEGAAILMASHDIFRVREVCHRIVILKQGAIVDTLKTETVSPSELEQIYLDYMKN